MNDNIFQADRQIKLTVNAQHLRIGIDVVAYALFELVECL